jgi:hypothetical protein
MIPVVSIVKVKTFVQYSSTDDDKSQRQQAREKAALVPRDGSRVETKTSCCFPDSDCCEKADSKQMS